MENTDNKPQEENLGNQPENSMDSNQNQMTNNQPPAPKEELNQDSQSQQQSNVNPDFSSDLSSAPVENQPEPVETQPAQPEFGNNNHETSKPEDNNEEKEGKGGIIATVVIIILAIVLIYYFNQGKDQTAENTNSDQNVNITVNDTQEEGQVTITDEENPLVDQNEEETDKMKIIVYYNNTVKDPGLPDCSKVYPLEIEVDRKYDSEVVNTVRGLLFPLAEEFTTAGWVSNFPAGTMLREVTINNGMAIANFTSALNDTAGSCQVLAIRAQIKQTLLQFPYIKDVTICVDSICNDSEILQP